MRAIVTGGEGGLGRAIRARLALEGYDDVEPLDLTTGFDVTDPAAWERIGPVDLACLNAGVLTGEADVRVLSDEQYRRAVAVNVDGVVFGVRRLARVMERGSIVVTASLAGLVGMPGDPVYSLTKHAVVGFVRSVAPHLAPVRINAVCPGIADTPMIDAQRGCSRRPASRCSRRRRSPRPSGAPRRAMPRAKRGSSSPDASPRPSASRTSRARASAGEPVGRPPDL